MASQTPLASATANVSHGVRNAMSATTAAVNFAIGPASGFDYWLVHITNVTNFNSYVSSTRDGTHGSNVVDCSRPLLAVSTFRYIFRQLRNRRCHAIFSRGDGRACRCLSHRDHARDKNAIET